MDLPKKKYHLESGLDQRDEAAAGFIRQTNPDGADLKKLDRGCRGSLANGRTVEGAELPEGAIQRRYAGGVVA